MSGSGGVSGPPKSRSLLVLRHEPLETLGSFQALLENNNISIFINDLGASLDRGDHDGILVMGGPQSANDEEMANEVRFIRRALDAHTPVLGICLGAQVIAKALGSQVYRNPEREIGWAPVYLTDAGKSDPVVGRLASPSTFFHWHAETFMLPAGAVSLAYSEKCRQQAFRVSDTVYGVQFHPEITPEMIVDWSDDVVSGGGTDSLKALDPNAADSRPLARQILEGWLETF